MIGRTYTAASIDKYRFSYNGKEEDNEVYGEENCIAFEERIYDSRLDRFLSTDPIEKEYAWQTPYAYFKNSPISTIDFMGKGEIWDDQSQSNSVQENSDNTESSSLVNQLAAASNTPSSSTKQSSSIPQATSLNTQNPRKEQSSTCNNDCGQSDYPTTFWGAPLNNESDENSKATGNTSGELSSQSFKFQKAATNWQAAAVSGLIIQLHAGFMSLKPVIFSIEVGVPVTLKNGTFIYTQKAATKSVGAANRAAVIVSSLYESAYWNPAIAATIPKLFASTMQGQLQITGARINSPPISGLIATPAIWK